MQVLIIAGNVGKDAVLRRTNSGDAVLGFSVAVDNGKDKQGNKRDSTWYDCSIWGKRAESLERHITKGTKLTLTGRPTAREHNGKAYLGISVNDLTFMGGSSSGGDRGGGSGGYDYQAPQADQHPPARDLDDSLDSIPF
jgi:single-strand DNA-binding protein